MPTALSRSAALAFLLVLVASVGGACGDPKSTSPAVPTPTPIGERKNVEAAQPASSPTASSAKRRNAPPRPPVASKRSRSFHYSLGLDAFVTHSSWERDSIVVARNVRVKGIVRQLVECGREDAAQLSLRNHGPHQANVLHIRAAQGLKSEIANGTLVVEILGGRPFFQTTRVRRGQTARIRVVDPPRRLLIRTWLERPDCTGSALAVLYDPELTW